MYDIRDEGQRSLAEMLSKSDLVLDSIFGYSYTGELRKPYDLVLEELRKVESKVLSVDMPSGWEAEAGNKYGLFLPMANISMMLPKEGMKSYKGRHFIGGRFLPAKIANEFRIEDPADFPGDSLFYELNK